MKKAIINRYNWTLHDVDETDFSNLMAFVGFDIEKDPDIKVIDGVEYKVATEPPDWL